MTSVISYWSIDIKSPDTLYTFHATSGKLPGVSAANQTRQQSVEFKERSSLFSPLNCIRLTGIVTQWDKRRHQQSPCGNSESLRFYMYVYKKNSNPYMVCYVYNKAINVYRCFVARQQCTV